MRSSESGARARHTAAAVVCGIVIVGSASCQGAGRTASDAIRAFVDAVQAERAGVLRCRLAGAAESGDDAAFASWLASRYVEYEAGRDAGRVDFGDDGIPLVRAFALGKGAFWQVDEARRPDPDTIVAETVIRFGYPAIDISGLVPGTVFYVCGTPLGRIHAVTIPDSGGRVDLEVLASVRVRWTLVHEGEGRGCPERWAFASVEPLPDTVETTRVTWVF